MNIEELAETEFHLLLATIDIYHQPLSAELDEKLNAIFASYQKVHQQYSDWANENDEALKRGLFIQWYALTEPNYLTGIGNLNENAQEQIIGIIEKKIQNNSLDDELKWMLNYYANWGWVFERFKKYDGLSHIIANRTENLFPHAIDRNEMKKRGQMGSYWNSLTRFKKME
jgi:hypothetical protein